MKMNFDALVRSNVNFKYQALLLHLKMYFDALRVAPDILK